MQRPIVISTVGDDWSIVGESGEWGRLECDWDRTGGAVGAGSRAPLNQERSDMLALCNRSMQRTVQSRLRVGANVKRTVGAGVEGAAASKRRWTRDGQIIRLCIPSVTNNGRNVRVNYLATIVVCRVTTRMRM